MPTQVYDQLLRVFAEQAHPDLVIYLQAKRKVEEELRRKNVPFNREFPTILEAVVNAYEHFFFHYKSSDCLESKRPNRFCTGTKTAELLHRLTPAGTGTQYFYRLDPHRRTGTGAADRSRRHGVLKPAPRMSSEV